MKVTLDVPHELVGVVATFRDPNSGRELSVSEVLETLVADLIMTETRPGSWEGANMRQMIDSHGWTRSES